MSFQSNLVKQHFNVRIFRSYFAYIRDHYPDLDVADLCQQAGLNLEYLQNDNNWVSCQFNLNLMNILSERVADPEFSKKIGEHSVSREGLGGALFHIGKNILDLNGIYGNLWRLSSYLNRVASFTYVSGSRNRVRLKLTPSFEGLDEADAVALKKLIPFMVENAKGYYSALPKLKRLPSAQVSVQETEDSFLFDIEYPVETTRRLEWILAGLAVVGAGVFVHKWMGQLSWGLAASFFVAVVYGCHVVRRMLRDLRATADHVQENIEVVNEQYRRLQNAREELDRKLLEARALNAVSSHLVADLPEQKLLENVCRDLCAILGFDRTLIFLKNRFETHLEYKAGFMKASPLEPLVKGLKFEINIRSDAPAKIANVFRKRSPVLIPDVESHLKTLSPEGRRALLESGSKSYLAVPVYSETDNFGVILADNAGTSRELTEGDMKVLANVAMQLAVVLQKARAQIRLAVAFDDIEQLAKSYSRFVPFSMIDLIGFKKVTDVHLKAGREYEMAILFSDIRGFTGMSEKMPPTDSVAFLNSYFSNLAPIFERHGGIIDKFLGDGMMVLFLDSNKAVSSAIEFQQRLAEYNQKHRSGGTRQFVKAGVGIHFGRVLLGAVGFEGRMSISVTSDSVNLASRLDGLNKKFGVDMVCSVELANQLKDQSAVRFISTIRVDGRESATEIFEIFGHLPEDERERRRGAEEIIRRIVQCMNGENHEGALQIAEDGLKRYPHDPVLWHYRKIFENPELRAVKKAG